MIISEQVLLEFKIRKEILITERISMEVKNQEQIENGDSIAYGEVEFFKVQVKFQQLNEELISLGEK